MEQLLLILVSYVLGSIPNGLLLARCKGIDIRQHGSGNIGATNVLRTLGKPWGYATFLLDFLKGFLAVSFLPELFDLALTTPQVLAGIAAIMGHNYPVFLRFKGGKGVATSGGVVVGVAPVLAGLGLLVWVLVFYACRYVSLASMVTACAVAIGSWVLYVDQSLVLPLTLTGLAFLIMYRHRSNVMRLLKGTENRFEKRKSS